MHLQLLMICKLLVCVRVNKSGRLSLLDRDQLLISLDFGVLSEIEAYLTQSVISALLGLSQYCT